LVRIWLGGAPARAILRAGYFVCIERCRRLVDTQTYRLRPGSDDGRAQGSREQSREIPMLHTFAAYVCCIRLLHTFAASDRVQIAGMPTRAEYIHLRRKLNRVNDGFAAPLRMSDGGCLGPRTQRGGSELMFCDWSTRMGTLPVPASPIKPLSSSGPTERGSLCVLRKQV
jgi:hypothetical protein